MVYYLLWEGQDRVVPYPILLPTYLILKSFFLMRPLLYKSNSSFLMILATRAALTIVKDEPQGRSTVGMSSPPRATTASPTSARPTQKPTNPKLVTKKYRPGTLLINGALTVKLLSYSHRAISAGEKNPSGREETPACHARYWYRRRNSE